MTHPYSRTRRRARDKRANPRRYRLTPARRAWLARDDALRSATLSLAGRITALPESKS